MFLVKRIVGEKWCDSGAGGMSLRRCPLLVDGRSAGVSCSRLQLSGWRPGLPEAVFTEDGVEQAADKPAHVRSLAGSRDGVPVAMGRLQPLRLYAGKEGRLRESGSAMSGMASSSKELSTGSSPVAEAVAPEPDAVEYPEGHWIAQSVWHGDAVRLATAALHHHFRDRDDVLVAMELVVYYVRGDNRVWLQPDVQVVFGVEPEGNRSTFKVWEEGKAPDFVLEVASPSTAKHDARYKAGEYARIGVSEYWRLDPEGALMGTALEGYAMTGGRYESVEAVERSGRGRHLRSRVLGLDLRSRKRDGATVLVFTDPRTGEEFDGALEEAERRRRIAEDRADAERDRADAAEDRVRALEERLRNRASRTRPSGLDS